MKTRKPTRKQCFFIAVSRTNPDGSYRGDKITLGFAWGYTAEEVKQKTVTMYNYPAEHTFVELRK